MDNILVKELGKRLLLTIIISSLVNLFLKFDFAYFFSWTLVFLNIPPIYQNNHLKFGLRVLLSLIPGIIGVGIIFFAYGIGRPLASFCVVLGAIYITSIVVSYTREKGTSKN